MSAFSLDGKIKLDARDFVQSAGKASKAIGDVDADVNAVPDSLDLDSGGFQSSAGKADKAIGELDASTRGLEDGIDLDSRPYVAGANRAEKQIDDLDASTKSVDDTIDLDSSGFVKGTDKASKAVDGLESDMDGLEGSAASAGGAAGNALGTSLMAGFGALGVGAVLSKAMSDGMDIEAGLDKVTAQFALTADEAERYGQIGGDLYADAWGDSVEEVTRVVAEVGRSLQEVGDIANDEMGNISELVIGVADVFDQDFDAVIRSVGQLMRNDLVDDAEEAMDLITVAFQQGGDRAGDLLDTIDEYSQHWAKLGIEGQEALGLIVEGFRQGQRDGDKLADLLKEFGIRALEDEAVAAFDALGFAGEQMRTQFGEGGEVAREALGKVIRALADTADPLEQNDLAIMLFGTQWEDVGPRVVDVLATIEDGLGEVEGAANDATDALADNRKAEVTARYRSIWGDVVALGVVLSDAAFDAVDFWVAVRGGDHTGDDPLAPLSDSATELTGHIGNLAGANRKLDTVTSRVTVSTDAEADALDGLKSAASDAVAELDSLYAANRSLADIAIDVEEAVWAQEDAVAAYTETIAASEAGSREYEGAVNDAETAVRANAQAQADAEIAQRLANNEVVTAQEENEIYRRKLGEVSSELDGPLKAAIDRHKTQIASIAAKKVTEIMAEMDVSRAQATLIEWTNRPRSLRIDTFIVTHRIDDNFRADGGPVAAGEVYTVGERGRELFVPDQNGTIIDARNTAAMLAPSTGAAPSLAGTSTSTVHNNGGMSVTFNGPVDDSRQVIHQIDDWQWARTAR